MPSDDKPPWPQASAAGWSLPEPAASDPARGAPWTERYERVGLIGRGGMGVVYAARDRLLDRTVALKEVEPGASPEALARLEREARLTASLEHPGVVAVHDLGRGEDGRAYYAMRLVRGRPLSAYIAESKDMRRRLALVRPFLDACQAVAHAHSHGVVHRDLKPDNIVLGELGEAQVIDWGLARAVGEASGGGGTPAYWGPLQAAGGPADPLDDVFSLGAVLAELLGIPRTRGRPPSGCPAEIAAIAWLALDGGYPDARAMAADCADWLDGRPVAAHRYTPAELLVRFARAWRGPLVVGALAVVVLVAVVAEAYQRNTAARTRAEAAELSAQQALRGERERFAAVLAARASDALQSGRWPEAEVLAARALSLRELPEARGVLASTMALGALPAPVMAAPTPCADPIGLSLTGEVICQEDQAIRLFALDGSERRLPTAPGVARVDEGSGIVWVQGTEHESLVVEPADGRVLYRLPESISAVLALDQGHLVGGSSLEEAVVTPFNGGPSRRLPACGEGRRRVSFVTESVGERVAQLCNDGSLFVRDRRGERWYTTPFGAESAGPTTGVFTPDGRAFILGTVRGVVGVWDLVQDRLIGRAQTRLGMIAALQVSPDGRFVSALGRAGRAALLRASTVQVVATLPGRDLRNLRFLADDRLVTLGARWELRALDTPLPTPEFVAGAGLSVATPSPDGAHLAAGAGDGVVSVWSLPEGALERNFSACGGVVKGLTWLDDARMVVVCASPSPRVLLDRRSGEVRELPGGSARRVVRLGEAVLTVPYTGSFYLDRPEGVTGCVSRMWVDLEASPGREQAIAASLQGEVAVLDKAGHCTDIAGLTSLGAVAIDDAGTRYISLANSVQAWRGDRVLYETPHPGAAYELALSPDNRWLAAGALDGSTRIYDAADGRLVAVLHSHSERVSSLSFSPDGQTLFTASWDGSVRLHALSALTESPERLQARAEVWGLDAERLAAEGASD